MPVIAYKPIVPKALKQAAIRDEVAAGMARVAAKIREDFQKTTKTWRHKPAFEIRQEERRDSLSTWIGTDHEVYGYISRGTRPHLILPRRGRVLAFRSKFRPKTKPHYITSYKGYYGGDMLLRTHVHHPGTKAREFDLTLAKRWRTRFTIEMRAAVARGARRSGHYLGG